MSYTTTATDTITHARYVAAKIAADLKRVQRLVGRGIPTDSAIAAYEEEATILLWDGYLGAVTYGFKENEVWTLAVQYTAVNFGLLPDKNPGRLHINSGNARGTFFSVLSYSDKWWNMPLADRQKYENSLPVKRSEGSSPDGNWPLDDDNSYRSGEIQVCRRSLAE